MGRADSWSGPRPVDPRHCGLVSIGITMRFAERILGCRLGGYMCRDFVGIASCVGPAGSQDYSQTAYRRTRGGQIGPKVLVNEKKAED